jgi:ribosome biogenesis GTPase A
MTQVSDSSRAGYIPASVADRFSDGWLKQGVFPRGTSVNTAPMHRDVFRCSDSKYRSKTLMLYCQKCFRLQTYRSESSPSRSKDEHSLLGPSHSSRGESLWTVEAIAAQIPDNAIIVTPIDVLNFESSIVPGFFQIFSQRRIPVVALLNKMDCLPVKPEKWAAVVSWAEKLSVSLRKCRGPDGNLDVVPISSQTDQGFEKLEKILSQYLSRGSQRPIYVVGRENSGKSTFLTRFLRYIGYKHLGCVHHKRGVGGLTRSPVPGTTQAFIPIVVSRQLQFFDTPGVSTVGGIDKHLRLSKDFWDVSVGVKRQPLTLNLREDKSLLIGAMCRIEVQKGNVSVTSFVSPKVTVHLVEKARAGCLIERKAGTFLYPPHKDESDSTTQHNIAETEWVHHEIHLYCAPSFSRDDICVSGLGWFNIYGNGYVTLSLWVPKGVRVFRRPALLPAFIRNFGKVAFHSRIRARGPKISRKKKELVLRMRDRRRRNEWRELSVGQVIKTSHPYIAGEDTKNPFVTDAIKSDYIVNSET